MTAGAVINRINTTRVVDEARSMFGKRRIDCLNPPPQLHAEETVFEGHRRLRQFRDEERAVSSLRPFPDNSFRTKLNRLVY